MPMSLAFKARYTGLIRAAAAAQGAVLVLTTSLRVDNSYAEANSEPYPKWKSMYM